MKFSSAQAALLHAGESAASSAILTLVVGIVQQLSTSHVSWSQLVTVFGAGFVGALGLIYKSVATSPDLSQAESDTTNQLATEAKSLAQQALGHIENMWPVLHNLTTQQATQKAAQSVVAPVSVPQMAFPAPAIIGNIPPIVSAPINMSVLPTRSFTQSALMPAVPK